MVWDDNPKFLYIYHQSLPRTQFWACCLIKPAASCASAKSRWCSVHLQRGVPLAGKRELSLGIFVDLRVYPVHDSKGKCFAVVAFDTNEPEDIFIATALEFLKIQAGRF